MKNLEHTIAKEGGLFTGLFQAHERREAELMPREHAFLEPPAAFEVGPCQGCGGARLAWSRFKNLVDCIDCGLNDVPVSTGLLANPQRLLLAVRRGLSLDRQHLASGRVERFDLNLGMYLKG